MRGTVVVDKLPPAPPAPSVLPAAPPPKAPAAGDNLWADWAARNDATTSKARSPTRPPASAVDPRARAIPVGADPRAHAPAAAPSSTTPTHYLTAREYWRQHRRRWTRADWDAWRAAHPERTARLPEGTVVPDDPMEREALYIQYHLCRWCGRADHWGNECPERPADLPRQQRVQRGPLPQPAPPTPPPAPHHVPAPQTPPPSPPQQQHGQPASPQQRGPLPPPPPAADQPALDTFRWGPRCRNCGAEGHWTSQCDAPASPDR